MKKIYQLIAGVIIVSLSFASHQANAAYSQMISFGDSTSDTGNRYIASNCPGVTCQVPSPPYWQGRETDGPVYNEILASNLGLAAPTPSLSGGSNYSISGARTLLDTSWLGVSKPSVQSQVNQYLSDNNGVADPNAIYTISSGASDITDVVNGDQSVSDLQSAAAGYASIANQLVAAGANSVMLINVGDVGKAPIAVGNEFQASFLTAISFNGLIEPGIAGVPEIFMFDAFSFHNQVDANPSAYGITNARGDCQADILAGLTSDCSSYFFMDIWHPSSKAHSLFAEQMTPIALAMAPATVVPVPAALPLFASALVGLGLFKRKF